VAQELIREAIESTTSSGNPHSQDWELDVFYTCDSDGAGVALGSAALVMSGTRGDLWRFGDAPDDVLDPAASRRWTSQYHFA